MPRSANLVLERLFGKVLAETCSLRDGFQALPAGTCTWGHAQRSYKAAEQGPQLDKHSPG